MIIVIVITMIHFRTLQILHIIFNSNNFIVFMAYAAVPLSGKFFKNFNKKKRKMVVDNQEESYTSIRKAPCLNLSRT